MAHENAETFRRVVAAFSRGDREAFLAEHHPDCETIPVPQWPEPGPYVGAAQWDFYADAEDVWRAPAPPGEEVEIVEAGEGLFVTFPRVMQLRNSGDRMDFTIYGAISFREGKLVRVQWFLERDDALAATGLTE